MKSTTLKYGPAEEFAGHALLTMLREPDRYHTLVDLCESYEDVFGHSYAEQVFAQLKRAGVPITSMRGPGGGYKAGPRLGEVTMLAVKQALGYAPTHPKSAWARAKNKALGQVTLADLVYPDESAPPV